MLKLKKLRRSIHFTAVIVVSLSVITIAIAVAALVTLRSLSNDSVVKLEKTINKYSAGLFLEDTQRKALAYSKLFNKTAGLTRVISSQIALSAETVDSYNFDKGLVRQYCDNFKLNSSCGLLVDNSQLETLTFYTGKKNSFNYAEKKKAYAYSFLIPLLKQICNDNLDSVFSSWVWFTEDSIFTVYSDNQKYIDVFLKDKNLPEFINKLEKMPTDTGNEGVQFTHSYSNLAGLPVISAVYKHYKNGKLQFITGLDIRLNFIQQRITEEKAAVIIYGEDAKQHNLESFGLIFSTEGKTPQIIAASFKNSHLMNIIKETDNSANSSIITKEILDKIVFELNAKDGLVKFNLNGVNYLLSYSSTSVKGWYLAVAVCEKNYLSAVKNAESWINKSFAGAEANFILVFIFFLLLTTLVLIVFFRKHIIKPLSKLRSDVFRMGHGNFDIVRKKYGVKEIANLADSFDNLGHRLEKYIKDVKAEVTERNKRDREMQVAKKIQQSVLPHITSAIKSSNVRLFARLHPARNVAGDFYDFFFISEKRLVCLVADVSGKGVSAAFYMTIAKRTIRNACINEPDDPGKALRLSNDLLCEFNLKMFVSVFLIYYDLDADEFKYANGGHNEPVILRKEGDDDKFFGTQHDMVLGMFPELEYHTATEKINVGDMLVLYTDGITEANASNDDCLGEERLMDFLVENKHVSAKNMCRSLIAFVHRFEKGTQYDDMTVVTFKRRI